MIIGTTPTFTLKLKRTYDVDLTTVQNVYVTLKQGTNILTKSGLDINIVDSKTVTVTLTQQESLNFSLDKKIELQLNWTYSDQGMIKRAATKIIEITLEKQLLTQVLQ